MRLADLLKQETENMNTSQIRRFKHELISRFPDYVEEIVSRIKAPNVSNQEHNSGEKNDVKTND